MNGAAVICTTWYHCVYDFQTLISGSLAIIAAVVTAAVIWRSAKLPFIEQERREKELLRRQILFASSVLSEQLLIIATRARQAEGTITVVVASNTDVNDDTRRRTILEIHPIVDDRETMSVLPTELLQRLSKLRHQIADHNFDMMRAGGAFGADNFRTSILARIRQIEHDARELSGSFAVLVQKTKN